MGKRSVFRKNAIHTRLFRNTELGIPFLPEPFFLSFEGFVFCPVHA